MKPLLVNAADSEADTLLADLRRTRRAWRPGAGANGLGVVRELLALALLLDSARPGMIEAQLTRAAAAHRREGTRSSAAMRKNLSHARAALDYGRVGGMTLPQAAARLPHPTIHEIEKLVRGVDVAAAIETRIGDLSGARGGRPPRPQLKALSAVIHLLRRAETGDGLAATEIDLIRSYLQQQAAA